MATARLCEALRVSTRPVKLLVITARSFETYWQQIFVARESIGTELSISAEGPEFATSNPDMRRSGEIVPAHPYTEDEAIAELVSPTPDFASVGLEDSGPTFYSAENLDEAMRDVTPIFNVFVVSADDVVLSELTHEQIYGQNFTNAVRAIALVGQLADEGLDLLETQRALAQRLPGLLSTASVDAVAERTLYTQRLDSVDMLVERVLRENAITTSPLRHAAARDIARAVLLGPYMSAEEYVVATEPYRQLFPLPGDESYLVDTERQMLFAGAANKGVALELDEQQRSMVYAHPTRSIDRPESFAQLHQRLPVGDRQVLEHLWVTGQLLEKSKSAQDLPRQTGRLSDMVAALTPVPADERTLTDAGLTSRPLAHIVGVGPNASLAASSARGSYWATMNAPTKRHVLDEVLRAVKLNDACAQQWRSASEASVVAIERLHHAFREGKMPRRIIEQIDDAAVDPVEAKEYFAAFEALDARSQQLVVDYALARNTEEVVLRNMQAVYWTVGDHIVRESRITSSPSPDHPAALDWSHPELFRDWFVTHGPDLDQLKEDIGKTLLTSMRGVPIESVASTVMDIRNQLRESLGVDTTRAMNEIATRLRFLELERRFGDNGPGMPGPRTDIGHKRNNGPTFGM